MPWLTSAASACWTGSAVSRRRMLHSLRGWSTAGQRDSRAGSSPVSVNSETRNTMRSSGTPTAAIALAVVASEVPEAGGSSVISTIPPALVTALSTARSLRLKGRPGR